jgi:hypothetical protein
VLNLIVLTKVDNEVSWVGKQSQQRHQHQSSINNDGIRVPITKRAEQFR